MLPLVRPEIPGMLFNQLTVDAKYSRYNTGNLPQPIKLQLS